VYILAFLPSFRPSLLYLPCPFTFSPSLVEGVGDEAGDVAMVHDAEDDEEVTDWRCAECTWTGNTMEEGSCNVCGTPKDPEDRLTFLQDQEQIRKDPTEAQITRLRQKQTNREQETAKWDPLVRTSQTWATGFGCGFPLKTSSNQPGKSTVCSCCALKIVLAVWILHADIGLTVLLIHAEIFLSALKFIAVVPSRYFAATGARGSLDDRPRVNYFGMRGDDCRPAGLENELNEAISLFGLATICYQRQQNNTNTSKPKAGPATRQIWAVQGHLNRSMYDLPYDFFEVGGSRVSSRSCLMNEWGATYDSLSYFPTPNSCVLAGAYDKWNCSFMQKHMNLMVTLSRQHPKKRSGKHFVSLPLLFFFYVSVYLFIWLGSTSSCRSRFPPRRARSMSPIGFWINSCRNFQEMPVKW
jgi:hypothetical protein